MTALLQLSRTFRRLGLVAAAGVLPAGAAVVTASPGASAAPEIAMSCSTTNLQAAIDNAPSGSILSVTGTCLGNYTINKNLTLVGHGPAVLDGQQAGITLTVSSGTEVELDHLTITDGNATSADLAGDGGGINNSGALTLNQSTVNNNTALSYGGGIYNSYSAALTLNQTTVSSNNGGVFGGGIYNNNTMTLIGSSVSENSTVYGGGGIFSCCGYTPVTLTNSTIDDNTATAGSGGGIFNLLDSETLQNSAVSGNTAALEGGGINNNAGTTTLDNSTVTSNTALSGQGGYFGGGIYDFSGTVPLTHSSVTGNIPGNCDPPGWVTGCIG
jgi:hypothetical protein